MRWSRSWRRYVCLCGASGSSSCREDKIAAAVSPDAGRPAGQASLRTSRQNQDAVRGFATKARKIRAAMAFAQRFARRKCTTRNFVTANGPLVPIADVKGLCTDKAKRAAL